MWLAKFGVPLYVVTDRGSQFESELFQELSKVVGCSYRLRTTTYHPQTNGFIERARDTPKTGIVTHKESWTNVIPIVLLGMHNASNKPGFHCLLRSQAPTPILISHLLVEEPNAKRDTSISDKHIHGLVKSIAQFEVHSFGKWHHCITNKTCNKVWLRVDPVRKLLEAPYTGGLTMFCHSQLKI